MCGRYLLDATPDELTEHFDLIRIPEVARRFNIAPTQLVLVVALGKGGVGRDTARVKWGLVPDWSNDPTRGGQINARAETVAWKPMFAESFKHMRCLIPATGFYEWTTEGSKKQPHRIGLKAGGLFAFAGLWSVWRDDDEKPLVTCAIITTSANDAVKPLHDRMPVILAPADYETWLDADAESAELRALLRPYPADAIATWRVSPRVNSPKLDEPSLAEPLLDGQGETSSNAAEYE